MKNFCRRFDDRDRGGGRGLMVKSQVDEEAQQVNNRLIVAGKGSYMWLGTRCDGPWLGKLR